MRRKVNVGDDFDSLKVAEEMKTSAEVITASTGNNESRTRTHLAYGAVVIGAVFVLSAGSMGVWDGSFNELQSIWNVLGPLIGGVFGYYFGGSGEKNQDDQNSR